MLGQEAYDNMAKSDLVLKPLSIVGIKIIPWYMYMPNSVVLVTFFVITV
jgi:hypothetical protein